MPNEQSNILFAFLIKGMQEAAIHLLLWIHHFFKIYWLHLQYPKCISFFLVLRTLK